jgi:ABC-type Mn2+/Zn2+ transport system permease subunit
MIEFVILPTTLLLKALIGSMLASVCLALVGVLIVRMRITSVGYCMSHAAFAGGALGILLEAYAIRTDPVAMSVVFSLAAAVLLGPLSDKAKLDSEVILGVLFSLFIALGFIFLALVPSGVVSSQSLRVLWGSIFGLVWGDFLMLGALLAVTIWALVRYYKEFLAVIFHPRLAAAGGVNVVLIKFFVLALTALVVSFSLKIIGALLVYALIINPSSTVYQFAYDLRKLFLYAPLVALSNALGGMFISLWLGLPVASSIILVSCSLFILATVFSPKRRTKNQSRKLQHSTRETIQRGG